MPNDTTLPSASVAAIASKAAGMVAMRIIGVAIGRGFDGEGPHSRTFVWAGSAMGPQRRLNFKLGWDSREKSLVF